MLKYNITPLTGSGYPQGVLRLDYTSNADGIEDWALILPPAEGVTTWVISLHGFDGKGNQLYVRRTLKKCWLPQYQTRGLGVLTPTLRGNAWMCPEATQDLDDLIAFLKMRYQAKNFIFSSGSLGASSNLIYAIKRPENVSAVIARSAAVDMTEYHDFCRRGQKAIPMLGDIADSIEASYHGTPEQVPDVYMEHSAILHTEKLMTIPIALTHGTDDILIPITGARQLAGKLYNHRQFCYVEVPNGDHESPFEIGQPGELFNFLDWILTRIDT